MKHMISLCWCIILLPYGCAVEKAASFEKDAVKVDSLLKHSTVDILDDVLDQKLANVATAEHIESLHNSISQTLSLSGKIFERTEHIQAEEINYGGAGWVLVTSVVFLGIGVLVVYVYVRYYRTQRLLELVIKAVNLSSRTQEVRDKIETEEDLLNTFGTKDRQRLDKFASKKDLVM